MTIKIGRKKALELMSMAVEAKGEGYVHPVCRYLSETGQGSCLVGEALFLSGGVSLSMLAAMDNALTSTTQIQSRPVLQVLKDAGVTLTKPAVDTFRRAQIKQDQGNPWGVALKAAKNSGEEEECK